MEYKVKVKPDKERDLFQLLKTWQKLGIVESFAVNYGNETEEDNASKTRNQSNKEETNDIVKQYWDLVD